MSQRVPTSRASTGTGLRPAIGAGIYERDIPGTCWSEEVNAMLLDDDPSNERLKEFVRCAAMELEMKGYFAINTLTTDPRWKHGSIYLFAIDTYGYTLFSGDSYSEPDDIMSELVGTDEDQDLVSVEDADAFGEIMSELVGPIERPGSCERSGRLRRELPVLHDTQSVE